MKLIDKDAVIEEIKRHKALWDGMHSDYSKGQRIAYSDMISFLDTIEIKEVDLDESARHYLLHEHISPLNNILHQTDLKVEMQYHKDIENAFKAGFELGLKAQKGE